MMGIFSILATPLGFIMKWIYALVQNYGWTIILFTILVRLILFPLSLKQQKSSARMAAYQPMIQEIQKKWASDKNRQNQELQKFYSENNIKMSAGCAPLIINMLVLFGMIAVIQAPLNYILQVPVEQIDNGVYIVEHFKPELKITENTYTQQSLLIGEIKEDPDLFVEGIELVDSEGGTSHASVSQATVDSITNFNFRFLGLNLSMAPSLSNWLTLIMPILSLLTMLGSQVLTMYTGAQQGSRTQMWVMTIVFGVMFGFFAFRVPSGFSLYYTTSNIIQAVQSLVMRKIYDPKKLQEEIRQEMEERKKAKKAKKQIIVTDEQGNAVKQDISEAELVKLRLAKAREQDAMKYGQDDEAESDAAKKAREIDAQRYGNATPQLPEKTEDGEEADDAMGDMGEEDQAPEADATAEPVTAGPAAAETKTSKPGRRRRARLQKEEPEEMSFAQREKAQEQSAQEEEGNDA